MQKEQKRIVLQPASVEPCKCLPGFGKDARDSVDRGKSQKKNQGDLLTLMVGKRSSFGQ